MAIWRIETCKAEAGYRSNASIYNLIRQGLWTHPVKIGARSSGWPDHEVRALCAVRIAGKGNDEIRALVGRLHASRIGLVPQYWSCDSVFEHPTDLSKKAGVTKQASVAQGLKKPAVSEMPQKVRPIFCQGLTAQEYFGLHQQLPTDCLERVLDQNSKLTAANDAVVAAWPGMAWNVEAMNDADRQRMEQALIALLEVNHGNF